MNDDRRVADTSPADEAATRSAAARLLQSYARGKARRRDFEKLSVRLPMDGRTAAGRAVRRMRDRILAELGPKPTPIQLVLVEQILQLKLRLAVMDQRFLAARGDFSVHDSREYLAWANSLRKALADLGFEAATAQAIANPEPSMADVLAAAMAAGAAPSPAARQPTGDAARAAAPADRPAAAPAPSAATVGAARA